MFTTLVGRSSHARTRRSLLAGPGLTPGLAMVVALGACSPAEEAPPVATSKQALEQETLEFLATSDTTVKRLEPFTNFGASERLGVSSVSIAGLRRALLRFDSQAVGAALAGRSLKRAELVLEVAGPDLAWFGGKVEAVALNMPWTEGDGDGALHPGAGSGATWRCARDQDLSLLGNLKNDCDQPDVWGMEPPNPGPEPFAGSTGNAAPTSKASKTLRLDVTQTLASVASGTTHGWLLKGVEGIIGGEWVEFWSSESARPPKLVLETEVDCAGLGVPTTLEEHARALRCKGLDDDCAVTLAARANYLAQKSARNYLENKTVTPAETTFFSRTVYERLTAALLTEASREAVCAADEDGDLVADGNDRCPGTPELDPADLNGCTIGERPGGPPRAVVDAMLARYGVMLDPECAETLPSLPVGGGVSYDEARAGHGPSLFLPAVEITPGCMSIYQVEGQMRATASAATTPLAPLNINVAQMKPVPSNEVLSVVIDAKYGWPADRRTGYEAALWVRYRLAQGNGTASGWSGWARAMDW